MKNKTQIQPCSFNILDGNSNYFDQKSLYLAHFNTIPNIKIICDIDSVKTKKFIQEEFKNEIIATNYSENCYKSHRKYADFFYVLKNKVLINLYKDNFYILFNPEEEDLAEKTIKNILPYIKEPKRTKEISLITSNQFGLDTKEIEISQPNLSFDLHYNDDFKVVHELVLRTLKLNNHKGLFLFHGLPGTGKSTYIKYLIHQQNKKVIFLSPITAGSLDAAYFTEFLVDNKNCIVVIEDAEELIVSRENNQNSHLSFLLNLTDGILADSLGIQIIATFNTDLKNIDKALLRKGRLTAIYEFKALEFQKANALFQHLKIENHEVFTPMTLADIYNYKEDNFVSHKPRASIGF